MDHLLLFIKGLAVGLAIAAPVGPVGVLCVRRTLNHGPWVGLASGLGAACADAVYGAIAAFGLSSVAGLMIDYQNHLRLFGGAFLLLIGARVLFKKSSEESLSQKNAQVQLAGAYASCFLLTLTNPATILSFIAIFAGLGLVGQVAGLMAALILVSGVFAGSAMWWLALSGVVGLLRGRVTPRILVWINRLSGAIIAGFGIGVLGSLVIY